MAFQLDTRIPLSAVGINIDPARAQAQAQAMAVQRENAAALNEQRRAMADQRQAQAAKLQREAAETAALKTAKTPDEIIAAVGVERGTKILQGIEAVKTARISNEQDAKTLVGSVVGGIKSLPKPMWGQAYDWATSTLVQAGLMDQAQVKPFSPQVLDLYQQWALTPVQQVTTAETARAHQVQEAQTAEAQQFRGTQFDETQRHNRAMEAKPTRPVPPVVIQTAAGPQLLDRTTGKTSPITNPEGQTVAPPPTADMRNKAQGRTFVAKSIGAIEQLSQQIITKVGPAQRAEAIKRGAEAVFGNDPEFRTYQDARTALAGNLAVAQQGSRPSDADIKAIWLPLVPDAYRDTKASAAMKWALIKQMSNVEAPAPAGEFKVGRFTVKVGGS